MSDINQSLNLLNQLPNGLFTVIKIIIEKNEKQQTILTSTNQILGKVDVFKWSESFLSEMGFDAEIIQVASTPSDFHRFVSLEEQAKIVCPDIFVEQYQIKSFRQQ